MSRVLLCEDLSYQVYRATAAHPLLTSRRHFTGGLYGFFTSLAKTVRETRATDMIICQDRKPYRRSLDYPDYKRLRRKAADEELLALYKESMALVIEVLEVLQYPIWGVDGFESDDLIAYVVRKDRNRFASIYAASNDSDLWQLLDFTNFHMYTSGGIADIGKERAKLQELGLTPQEFMHATAMTGTHNDIEGIPRCGIVTATKALKDPKLMRNFRSIYGSVIDRNLELIKLPHPDFPRGTVRPAWTAEFSERTLYRILGKYDIDCTASMVNAFRQLKDNNETGRQT